MIISRCSMNIMGKFRFLGHPEAGMQTWHSMPPCYLTDGPP